MNCKGIVESWSQVVNAILMVIVQFRKLFGE